MTVASVIPIHILADEKKRIWESELPEEQARKVEREKTTYKWLEGWSSQIKGAWTRRLIPRL